MSKRCHKFKQNPPHYCQKNALPLLGCRTMAFAFLSCSKAIWLCSVGGNSFGIAQLPKHCLDVAQLSTICAWLCIALLCVALLCIDWLRFALLCFSLLRIALLRFAFGFCFGFDFGFDFGFGLCLGFSAGFGSSLGSGFGFRLGLWLLAWALAFGFWLVALKTYS